MLRQCPVLRNAHSWRSGWQNDGWCRGDAPHLRARRCQHTTGNSHVLVAYRHLPVDRKSLRSGSVRFDTVGTLLLALTLAAYALAMRLGRGSFGVVNVTLLAAAAFGLVGFILAEPKIASPLIRLEIFRDPRLSASLAMSTLVSTVMMATLVVGPFYLSHRIGQRRYQLAWSCRSVRSPPR